MWALVYVRRWAQTCGGGGTTRTQATSAAVLRSRLLSSDGATAMPFSASSSEQDSLLLTHSMPEAAAPRRHYAFYSSALHLETFHGARKLHSLGHSLCVPARATRCSSRLIGHALIRRALSVALSLMVSNARKALGDEYLFAREKSKYVGRYNVERRASLLRESVSVTIVDWARFG